MLQFLSSPHNWGTGYRSPNHGFLCHNNLTFIGRVTVIVSIVVFIFLLLLRVRGNPLTGLEHVENIPRIKMIALEQFFLQTIIRREGLLYNTRKQGDGIGTRRMRNQPGLLYCKCGDVRGESEL